MDQRDSHILSSPPVYALETVDLGKVYPGARGRPPKTALKGVSLSIPRGSFFGLLGPNGAGKSTFINILAGLTRKTSGTVQVWESDLDRDPRGTKCALGVVPQELNFDPFFTPAELLDVQAGMYGVPKSERRTREILEAVGLADKADAYARTLSGGMRRRLLIAKAMVHAPPILILDEPTAGVDIELRQSLWTYVRQLNAQGTTIILTTHYLEEAEELCSQIAIINHGSVVACDTTQNLLRRLDSKTILLTFEPPLQSIPEALMSFSPEMLADGRMSIHYKPSLMPISRILESVRAANLTIADLSTEETSLEDIFLQLTSSKR